MFAIKVRGKPFPIFRKYTVETYSNELGSKNVKNFDLKGFTLLVKYKEKSISSFLQNKEKRVF